jgi:hypothetical protein
MAFKSLKKNKKTEVNGEIRVKEKKRGEEINCP